jgi:transposase
VASASAPAGRGPGEADYWDGTVVCLFAKPLEDSKFRWPSMQDGVMRLSAAELSALLEGLDWKRVHAARETPAMQPG